MARVSPTVKALIEPVVTGLGYELVGVEYLAQGHHSLLRVYVDSDAGITVDDCADVSRQLSAMLDVEDPLPGAYSLEVSSPGVDRPLFEAADFERFSGQQARIRLLAPLDGQRKFKGVLTGIQNNNVLLMEDGREVSVPLDRIAKANLVAEL
jgi:ribosome maturation factor RimP